VYHVTARGNRGAAIFLDEIDHQVFLVLLAQVARVRRWRCLSYCLMGNHFHLSIQTREPNLADGMHRINGLHAQAFNKRHRLSGHLFQGRYHAVRARTDAQLLESLRYIALNPVRADLCARPRDWRWSAHAALAGSAPPGFVAVEHVWSRFAADGGDGRERYVDFVEEVNPLTKSDYHEPRTVLGGEVAVPCTHNPL
jgi:putative transposase